MAGMDGMRHVEDSINAQGLVRIQANYVHLHANQYVRVGRRDMMTSNECSCMSQDPAQRTKQLTDCVRINVELYIYRTKQLTDFVRINVELVRGQLAQASFGRNVQVIDRALNQVVLHIHTAVTRKGH